MNHKTELSVNKQVNMKLQHTQLLIVIIFSGLC